MNAIQLLEPYSTCDIADALTQLGIACAITTVQPIIPHKMIGPAHTVLFVDAHEEVGMHGPHHVDCAETGTVVVMQQPQNAVNAVWGGLLTTRAQKKHLKGVVVEGFVRDKQELVDFPVFAKNVSPLGAKTFVKVAAINQDLILAQETLYPVKVSPGDIIVGDENGVVCCPKEVVLKVAELCRKNVETDECIKQDLLQGMSLKDSFAKRR